MLRSARWEASVCSSVFPFFLLDISPPFIPFLVTFEQTVFRSAAGSDGFLRSCVTSLLVFAYYMTFTYSPSAVDCFLCLSLLLLSSTLPVSSFSFTFFFFFKPCRCKLCQDMTRSPCWCIFCLSKCPAVGIFTRFE